MALDPRLILSGVQQSIAANRPISSLLEGVQAGHQFAGEQQRQTILGQQAAQQQQLGDVNLAIKQRQLDLLGVPDETTAKQFAFDAARLSVLPDEQMLGAAQAIRQKAIDNNRSTNNIDEFISTYERDSAQAKELLGSFVEAAEKTGFLEANTATTLRQQQIEQRNRQLALEEQREKRQAGKLSAASEKALIESQDLATRAGQNATEFDILANQIRDAGLTGGLAASTTESFKQLLGTQDDVTDLRRRFNKVRLSEGLKNLPPGPATDRDVQEAFKGVPPENAPAGQIESFLRGASKMAKFDQAWHEFRAEYISKKNNTQGLINAWKARAKTIADGIVTKPEVEAKPKVIRFDAQGNIIQ